MIKVYKSEKGRAEVLQSYDELLKQWGVEFKEEDIDTSFGATHCIITGDPSNPPLIMLHGVGDNSAIMWVMNIRELSRHFYCIAVDTLGGPGKSVPGENFRKGVFSQQGWLNELADNYKLERFNIAGVSNGAAMAFNYAVREPGRIARVVCLEGGMITSPMKSMISTIGMLLPEILVPTKNNMIKIMRKMISPNSETFDKHPQYLEHLVMLMKNHNRNAMFIHALDKYDKERSAKIIDRIYILLGDHHLDKRAEYIKLLEEAGCKYKIIKNAGHGVNHEQPEAVNREIIEFLSNIY